MALFNKLSGYQQTPAGLERKILRLIPGVFTFGIAILVLPSLVLRLTGQVSWNPHEMVSMVDIYAVGAILLFCNLTVAVGVGALVVMLMKGPAYVADGYTLIDSDAPAQPLGNSKPDG